MRWVVVSATAFVGIFLVLLLLTAQGFPQFFEEALHQFKHPWRTPPLSPLPGMCPTSETGQVKSNGVVDEDTAKEKWEFHHQRDGNNHGLDEAQCMAAFPLLYKEIDRAVEYRHKVGNITIDDVDVNWRNGGIVRILVRDNHVYLVDALNPNEGGHRFRNLATLHSLNTAVTSSQERLPNVEFTYTLTDWAFGHGKENGDRTTLAYSRTSSQESLWLMPDFGFWGWPKIGMNSYSDLRAMIDESENPFLDKIPKLVWRGGLQNGNEARFALLRESEGQSWSDVRRIIWNNETDVDEHLMTMEQHCDYMFAAMTEGQTWSGRLKFLLNCHSIVVSHELEWIEFYYHLLSSSGSSQNYVKLDKNFDKLGRTMDDLLEPTTLHGKASRIADNARHTFRERYLTPAAIACYWRALIRGWASVQGFEPDLWTETDDNQHAGSGKGNARRRLRGTPFESYIIMEALDWEVPALSRKLIIDEDS